MKRQKPASTHKKVVIVLLDGTILKGYLNPAGLPAATVADFLTIEGEHQAVRLEDAKAFYFVDDFQRPHEPERKTFLSRPKIEGLWLKLIFRDRETIEGIASNELLDAVDRGVQFTTPDLQGNCARMFVPRTALSEVRVLGLVGVAKRATRPPAAASVQPRLFDE